MKHTFTYKGEPVTKICGGAIDVTLDSKDILKNLEAIKGQWPTVSINSLKQLLTEAQHVSLVVPLETLHELPTKWNKDHTGWKLVQLLSRLGMAFVKPPAFLKLMTLDYKLDKANGNPLYQSVHMYYHSTWTRMFREQPRLHISLQAFLKEHLGVTPSNKFLKECLNAISDSEHDLEDYFKIVSGDDPNAPEIFTEVYTNYERGDYGCSVSASCMKYAAVSFDDTDGHHPVEAYCSSDIALAYVTHPTTGNTRARALLNLKHNTYARVYVSGTTNDATRKLENAFCKLLEAKGFTYSYSTGLRDCHMKLIKLPSGKLLAPYIDGDSYYVDTTTGKIYGYNRAGCSPFRSTEGWSSYADKETIEEDGEEEAE